VYTSSLLRFNKRMKTSNSFGYWIRRQRKALDLTQQSLAERVGCSVAAIKKIEGDERRPSRQIAARLADVLGVPASQRDLFLNIARGLRPVDQLSLEQEPQVLTSTRSSAFPTGTVSFLYTDIEGSTQLWKQNRLAMAAAHARHDQILRESIESSNGYVFQVVGDAFCAAFQTAADAVRAAMQSQIELDAENWGETPIRVRMGIHTGNAEIQEDGYYSGFVTLSHVQRLMSVAHGGQVLLSFTTYQLVQDELPENVELRDMGQRQLKDWSRPEHIFQLVISGLQADFPPLSTPESFPHNLPIQLTSFIGREHEKTEIKALLKSARLITLTGSGGTGKTRLALEVGAEELSSFTNGVWLIELAPLADPSQIIPALAQIFGLREHPFAPLTMVVIDYLRDKKLLLLLDNCEHLIEACAGLADDLLHQCAGLKVLATSREAFGIAGEMAYHTPSLAASESTRLFMERARAVNSNLRLTPKEHSSITQICTRLDGIPLAIELAAARVKLMSIGQIAARLDDRFRLLVGGSRTALPRQQTLRSLIDWSYDLLSKEEKRLLQFASVFVGGWTLDALEAVADDPGTMEHLEGLVNKSLVVTRERESEIRYFLLEMIRQYAWEKLFETNQSSMAREQHFVYFDTLSEKIWEAVRSPDLLDWRDRVEDEAENFRAAVEWGLENHAEDALHLAANFCDVSDWISRISEGMMLVQSAVERVRALPDVSGAANTHRQKLIARAFLSQALAGMSQGNLPFAIKSVQEAITLSRATGDKFILGNSLIMYVAISSFINAPGASEAAHEALTIFTNEVTDLWGLGMAYLTMARIASSKGDPAEKQKYMGKLKELIGESSLSYQTGMLFLIMGMDESAQGNYGSAKQFLQDGWSVFKPLKYKHFELAARSELGHVARHTGNLGQAKQIYSETIMGWKDLGNRGAIAHEMECFAFIAITEEELQRALKLFGAAEALREKAQSPMTDQERVEYDQAVAQMRELLNASDVNSLWADGRVMSMEQAIAFALEG